MHDASDKILILSEGLPYEVPSISTVDNRLRWVNPNNIKQALDWLNYEKLDKFTLSIGDLGSQEFLSSSRFRKLFLILVYFFDI